MFTIEKITQVAAYLLKKAGGKLNYTAFLKLLYIADRKMLLEWGIPITYDKWYLMPKGPVLSMTYDLIRTPQDKAGYWGTYIRTQNYDIELVESASCPEGDLLSEAEEEIIDSIFAEHGKKDWKALVAMTHGLAEWSDPNGTSKPLSYKDVLASEGRLDEDDIEAIVRSIEEEKGIAELVASGNSNDD